MSDFVSHFFASHLSVLPVLLPLFTAATLLLMGDGGGQASHGGAKLRYSRLLSLTSALIGALLAWKLMSNASTGTLSVYPLGGWSAPFGIVLVVDRLSAMMLALTWTIAVPVLWYATGGWDSHGRYFHALFHFQLMGLSGAFVTGDLFNLFVFFEVLLIASYVLLVHGHGRERFKVGLHYVVLNLVASALFLIGLAVIYGVAGTLNMADLAIRVAQLAPQEASLFKAGALLLLVVFGLKAAIVPLYMWLPGTYAAASAPVAALFAIMTKVGVYSIIRVHAGILGESAGHAALAAEPWLLPVALTTTVLGVFGALASHSLSRLVSYLTVASVGTILAAVGLFTPAAMSAALYYMVHSTLVIAALFLLVELVASQRGDIGDRLQPSTPVAQPIMLGLMTLLGAASVAGLPPLPGFLGKLMVLQSAAATPAQGWVWAVVLSAGFLTLIGLARAGSILFWQVLPINNQMSNSGGSWRLTSATLGLLGLSLVLATGASPLKRYTDAAAVQLADHTGYAQAVLGPVGGAAAQTTRPYRGGEGDVKLPPQGDKP
ncbi:monovalent cation/H+ antiporter subunit D [Rhodoferax sp. PAMC 29310]|uniref:monovalent cation/H+ antiporter subunit D n=1 Tax=Rhodoferax sp. PAMC 29310 TaxID=2822760 RepID=UPI001B31D3B3|nr:monovalent cation/H+ antiporter subunit D [Rhodoferax sp. PAMC 29310]